MILCDHCVPGKFARFLREQGFTVVTVAEQLAPGASDSEVLALAQQMDAVLLTVDLDFADITIYPPTTLPGVIVMRAKRRQDEEAVMAVLLDCLKSLYRDGLRASLVVVNPQGYRVRRSPKGH